MVISFFRLETEGLFRGLAEYLEKLEAQIPVIQQSEYDKIQEWAKQESVEYAEYGVAIDELRTSLTGGVYRTGRANADNLSTASYSRRKEAI